MGRETRALNPRATARLRLAPPRVLGAIAALATLLITGACHNDDAAQLPQTSHQSPAAEGPTAGLLAEIQSAPTECETDADCTYLLVGDCCPCPETPAHRVDAAEHNARARAFAESRCAKACVACAEPVSLICSLGRCSRRTCARGRTYDSPSACVCPAETTTHYATRKGDTTLTCR